MTVTPPRDRLENPNRGALLACARDRFRLAGFHSARLVDIAGDAGLTTGAFYRYFASKTEAFHVLFAQYVDELSSSVAGASSLTDYATRWLDVGDRHRGTLVAAEEITRDDPAFSAHRERCRQAWAAAAMVQLPDDAHEDARRDMALVVVDTLDYYWQTTAKGWSRIEPSVAAENLELLVRGGIYVPSDGRAVSAAPEDRDGAQPALPRQWRWETAKDRAEPASRRGKSQVDAILAAATLVYAGSGFSNATIGQIAQRTGVSAATVYRYFADKKDIFLCLLGRLEDVLYGEALFTIGPDGRLIVYPATLRYLEARARYAAVYRVWRELAWHDPDMEAAWVAQRRHFQDAVARIVTRGQRAGIVHEGLDPQAAAEISIGAFDGTSHTRVDLGWDTHMSDERLAAALAALLGTGVRRSAPAGQGDRGKT